MPQVLEQNGFRVMIYPDDHRHARVHVYKSGLIIIRPNNRRTPPSIREVIGMSRKEARDALRKRATRCCWSQSTRRYW